jgi:PAS domain S-box-containing protein
MRDRIASAFEPRSSGSGRAIESVVNTIEEADDKLRILLLEDIPDEAELIALQLRKDAIAHSLKCVCYEREFVQALSDFKPDLILSDHKLPDMTALQALTIAREKVPDLPFILVTGVLQEELAVEIVRHGATDFILKDRLSRLGPAVHRALQEAEERAQRRAAEANYRSIYENAIHGIFQTTPEGRYISANPALARILGYSSPEELVSSISDLGRQMCVAPESRLEMKQRLERDGYVRDFENQIYRKDGARIWITVNARVVHDGNGRVLYYEGTSQDITARKKAATELATLAHAVESTGELICITDLDDRFIFVNKAFLHAYGYSEAEILGKTPEILFSRANPPNLKKEIFEQTRAGGWKGEVIDRRKDGTELPIFLSTSQVKDQAGRVIGLMGVAQDITERKRAEKEIRLLADAVQGANELISVTDEGNRFIFANRAFLETYGYQADEILGQKPNLLYSPSNSPGLCELIFQQALAGSWQGELLNRKKDGTEFPISLSTTQIKDKNGRIVGLVGVARDISERKRSERQAAAFAALGYRLSSATSVDQAAEIVMQVASELFGWDAGYFHLYSLPDHRIIPVLTVDTVDGQRMPIAPNSFTLDPSPLMRVVMTEGARLVNRDQEEPASLPFTPFGDQNRRSASMMYVPLRWAGAVLGVLSIQSYTPRAYTPDDLGLFQTLADHCGGALQRIEVAVALVKAEFKYRSIFESATEGIFQTTYDGRYLNVNPALARMFGYRSADELIASVTNIEAQTFVSKEDARELKQLLAANDSVLGFEAERYRKDKSRYWTSINVRTVRAPNGEFQYYEGTVQDITPRKQAQAVLRASEEKFRTLFESAPIGMALLDADGKYLKTNGAYRQLLGYSEDELLSRGYWAIPHRDDLLQARDLFRELIEGRRARYRMECRYLDKDGHIIWAQVSDSVITDIEGNFAHVISMLEDVSEQMRFLKALRDSERKLRLIAENTEDVIFSFDMQRRPTYANHAVERVTGYTFKEIQQHGFVNWLHPHDQERMLKLWDDLFLGTGYSEVEFRLVTKSGETKWCSSTWGPLFDEAGRQIGVQGRERDITERKYLERELVESGNNERRRVGHELHDGLCQFLAGVAFKAKALEHALINDNTARAPDAKELAILVSDAITQTRRIARGLAPIDVETIGLLAALQNLVGETEKTFQITCLFTCSEVALKLNSEPALAIYRISQESIHNAIAHGNAQRVEVSLSLERHALCVRIKDDGCGFDPELTGHSGMGLRTMQYRARSIGGQVTLRSAKGQGTEVCASVPRAVCVVEKQT